MGVIRPCRGDERPAILAIINDAAQAYRGVIPPDHWREPYMSTDQLDAEVAAGVTVWGYEADGVLVGVMGVQAVREVDLIRHAYVAPGHQGHGIGGALLEHLIRRSDRRTLVGTWAAAEWAVRFYLRHGFELVAREHTPAVLRTYWTISQQQIDASVVLANPPLDEVTAGSSPSG